MSKLTPEKCRTLIGRLSEDQRASRISIFGELYLQALEIALPVLEKRNKCWTYIRFMDRSKNQCMKCKIAYSDGFNSLIYDDEGCPILISNNSYEEIKAQPRPSTPQIDNDVWIEWKGGKCPCDYMANVEVRLRSGNERVARAALSWEWKHHNNINDIIAYRVIENDGREG